MGFGRGWRLCAWLLGVEPGAQLSGNIVGGLGEQGGGLGRTGRCAGVLGAAALGV